MTTADRERQSTEAFVKLISSLVDGQDVAELLTGLAQDITQLLNVAATGILLADVRGELHLVAASSEATRSVELFQLQRSQGPCLDCFRAGSAVTVADLQTELARWPAFVPYAVEAGFASVHTLPMGLPGTVLGAVGLFGTRTGALGEDDLHLGQALAYVAAVTLTRERAAVDAATVNRQLQQALDNRVVLEQAKGVLAQSSGLDMDPAFALLRKYARDHNLRLTDVAADVAARRLPAEQLIGRSRARNPRSRPGS